MTLVVCFQGTTRFIPSFPTYRIGMFLWEIPAIREVRETTASEASSTAARVEVNIGDQGSFGIFQAGALPFQPTGLFGLHETKVTWRSENIFGSWTNRAAISSP